MRENKFRAWYYDGKNLDSGEMQYDVAVWGNLAYVLDKGMKVWSNCVKIMQYTGLFDKKGKEICEFDYVKTPKGTGLVFKRLGCWFVEMQKVLGYFNIGEIEIIGNIYEHKYLLDNS